MSDQNSSSRLEAGVVKEPAPKEEPGFDSNATLIGLLREMVGLQRQQVEKPGEENGGGKKGLGAILEKALVPLLIALVAALATGAVGWLQAQNARTETLIKLLPKVGDDEQKKLSSLMAIYAMGYEDKAIKLAKSYSLSGVGGLAALVQIGSELPGDRNTSEAKRFVQAFLEEKPDYCQEVTIREMFCELKNPELTAKAVRFSQKEGTIRGLLSIVQCPDIVGKSGLYHGNVTATGNDGTSDTSGSFEEERKRVAQEVAIDTLLRVGDVLTETDKLFAQIEDKYVPLSTARRFGPRKDYFIWKWNTNEKNRDVFQKTTLHKVGFLFQDTVPHKLKVLHHVPSVYDKAKIYTVVLMLPSDPTSTVRTREDRTGRQQSARKNSVPRWSAGLK